MVLMRISLKGVLHPSNTNILVILKLFVGSNFISSLIRRFLNGDFPGGTVVKNPPASAGDTGSSPGPGRSHMTRSN